MDDEDAEEDTETRANNSHGLRSLRLGKDKALIMRNTDRLWNRIAVTAAGMRRRLLRASTARDAIDDLEADITAGTPGRSCCCCLPAAGRST